MSVEAKHVLFREDLEPAFDEAAILAEMESMDKSGGEWRDHIPYAAAREYHNDPEMLAQYAPHVEECLYCQRLIDAVSPADRLIDELQTMRRRVTSESTADGNTRGGIDWWRPVAVAAGLLMGVVGTLGTLVIMNIETTSEKPLVPSRDSVAALVSDLEQLRSLEAINEPVAKFQAARIYLATKHPQLAYSRIGQGFRLAKLDDDLIRSVVSATELTDNPSASLENGAREFPKLLALQLSDEGEQLRRMQVFAKLGRHEMAMESLRTVLEQRGDADEVVRALKEAKLVTSSSSRISVR